MKLDFALLSQPTSAAPLRKLWGQAGTAGTQASMRAPASPGIGDRPGTGGDNQVTVPVVTSAVAGITGLLAKPCPQASPLCPHSDEAQMPNEINVSPMSPLVPDIAGKNPSGDEIDMEVFEERAAIMQFDGGMARVVAEAAARAMLGGDV
jgi:hypothetical protein